MCKARHFLFVLLLVLFCSSFQVISFVAEDQTEQATQKQLNVLSQNLQQQKLVCNQLKTELLLQSKTSTVLMQQLSSLQINLNSSEQKINELSNSLNRSQTLVMNSQQAILALQNSLQSSQMELTAISQSFNTYKKQSELEISKLKGWRVIGIAAIPFIAYTAAHALGLLK